MPEFVGRFGICARSASRANFEAFLGPRSSRFERLKQLCVCRVADCGFHKKTKVPTQRCHFSFGALEALGKYKIAPG
eukprot:15462084-Alexandrium_andersonii.AAC.1